MNRCLSGFVCLVLMTAAPIAAAGVPGWSYDEGLKFNAENFELSVNNRTQVRFTYKDPELGDESASFDLSQYKLTLTGKLFKEWTFRVQTNFTDTENSPRALEDAYFMFTRRNLAQLWVGQGKTFFGRQQQTSSGSLQFIERSIASAEFRHGDGGTDNRDVGLALYGENAEQTYHYAVGVYNGNGINKDEDDNTDYMVTGKLVVTPFGPYDLEETDLSWLERRKLSVRNEEERKERRKSRLAVGVSARAITEGTEAINEELRDTTAVLEVAYKVYGLNLVGEFFTRSADLPLSIPGNESDTDGWYAQAGWLFGNGLEVAGRYSEIIRDTFPDDDETEWGVALNYYMNPWSKFQLDYRDLQFEGVPSSPDIDNKQLRAQLQMTF